MIRIALLQSDSSHAETYIALANGDCSPVAGRAQVVSLWGEEADQAAAKATHGVRLARSIEAALEGVDVAMVCGRWGDSHHEVAARVIAAGKPLYVDKPLSNSLADAVDLERRAAQAGVPAFSASPLRFAPELAGLMARLPEAGDFSAGSVTGLASWPDFGERGRRVHFYGVHSAEILHAVFGPGPEAVRVEPSAGGEIALVRYPDGRVIAWNLLAGTREIYAATLHGTVSTLHLDVPGTSRFYEGTLNAVVTMAESGQPPIPFRSAVEIVGMLDAVEASRLSGGWEAIGCLE